MNWSMQTIDPLVSWVNIMNWSMQTIDSRQLGQYYELVSADYRPSCQLGQYELVSMVMQYSDSTLYYSSVLMVSTPSESKMWPGLGQLSIPMVNTHPSV